MVTLLRWLAGARGAVRPVVLVSGGVAASAVAVVIAIGAPGGGGACTGANVTTATLSARLAAASPGNVLCLSAGTYSNFPKRNSSSPGISITHAPGVAQSTVRVSVTWADAATTAAWLIFDGVTFDGIDVSAPVHDVTWRNSEMAGLTLLRPGGGVDNDACGNCPNMDSANLVIGPNNDLTMSNCPAGNCGGLQGRITITRPGTPLGAGITIVGNHFDGTVGPCHDGILFGSDNLGSDEITIRDNHFDGINVANCDLLEPWHSNSACFPTHTGACPAPHPDGIQGNGYGVGSHTLIEGNFFDHSSTGVTGFNGGTDANGTPTVINNVFNTDGDAICVGGATNPVYEHNTIIGGQITLCVTHEGAPTTGTVWKDNVMSHDFDGVQGGSTFAAGSPDYDWCITQTCAGAHSLNGAPSPSWVGGVTPVTFAGFALTPASRGTGVASDGTNIGVNP